MGKPALPGFAATAPGRGVEGVPPGERVMFEGFGNAPEAQLNPKRKIWEKIAPSLVTSAGEQAAGRAGGGRRG